MNISKIKKERIQELKLYKALANKVLDENKALISQKKHQWQNHAVENNIKNLKEIITDINKDLKNNKRIERYCLAKSGDRNNFLELFKQTNSLSILGRVSNFTVPNSLLYDINWLKHFTIGEKFEISIGKKGPAILEKYWDYIMNHFIKIIVPELKKNKDLSNHASLIIDAINIAKNKSFIASNIILFTVAESLVRVLAKKVYQGQNPQLSEYNVQKHIDNFQSLENLLKSRDWKNDIELKTTEVVTRYDYINEEEIIKAKEVITNAKKANIYVEEKIEELTNFLQQEINKKTETVPKELKETILGTLDEVRKMQNDFIDGKSHTTKINLRIRLHFLIRRYKEDRNNMIHGKFEGFNHKWKNYIYLSAIEQIYDVIKEYGKIYGV